MTQSPGAAYTISPRQLGPDGHIDSEGYLQTGRSQPLADSVTVTVGCGSTEESR